MWDLGNLWTEGSKSTAMDASPSVASFSYLQVMNEIHVLLVDHDSDGPMNTAKLLESCQYRVTFVELASSAVTMLTNGKVKYDIVMANVNSPDLHGYKLLQEATKMNIPIIFMSIDDNAFMAMKAIESGAFLYVKKPATKEMMSCLWQHVTREKTKMMMIRERDGLAGPTNYNIARGVEFREVTQHRHAAGDQNPNNAYGNNMNNMLVTKDNKGKAGKIFNMGGNAVVGDENLYDSEDIMMLINHNNKIKRKVCTEWTQELHEKFMEAVEQLGEGRCFPKEILELMDVPGLTRMQVASHLQKCRNDNWRSPEERKASLAAQTVSSDSGGSHYKPRRFGSMPRLGKAGGAPSASYQTIQEANGVGQGSKTLSQSETANESHVGNMGIGSIVVANDTAPRHHPHQPPQQINYGGSPSVNAAAGAAAAAPPTPAVQIMYAPNPRQHPPADDFFSFQDMDCLIQNFQGNMPPQGSAGAGAAGVVNVPNSGGYHYDPVYHHEQNRNKVGSVDNRSHWSSDTSNFESDESENRGRR